MTRNLQLPVSYLTADGVFDSMRTYAGRLFRREEHLNRLFRSAASVGLNIPYSKKELREKIQRVLAGRGKNDVYVRVGFIRAGNGTGGLNPSGSRLNIIVTDVKTYPERYYRGGVRVITVGTRRPHVNALFPHAKSLNFLSGMMARIEAGNAFEALMFNPGGYLTEGTVSNVFMVKRSRLYTPSLYLGILPGITRGKVMELAGGMGIEARESVLTRHDFYTADEVFLTNTTMEIMPVNRIDGRLINRGRPGALTRRILRAFRKDTENGR